MGRAYTEVQLHLYDSNWPRRFEATKQELRLVFPKALIEHVGSTSVPGLSSKDTIDIAVGVSNVAAALDQTTLSALSKQGFEYIPASFADDPDHSFLHRIVGDRRTDHVHVVRSGSEALTGYLLFRDYLRATPDAMRRYEQVKRHLAERFHFQRDAYVEQKQSVVDGLMAEARAWAVSQQIRPAKVPGTGGSTVRSSRPR